jgi:DNA-directed RNA polymerase subunit RPC12/RpoP
MNPLGLECPHCNSKNILFNKRGGVYWCRKCGTEFSIRKTATGYERTPFTLSISKVLAEAVNAKRTVASRQRFSKSTKRGKKK